MRMRKTAMVVAIGLVALAMSWGSAFAGHNGAQVVIAGPGGCGETTFTASVTAGLQVDGLPG